MKPWVRNSILIFGFGPIPAMGMEGAAIATLLSWLVGFIFVIYVVMIKKELIHKFNIKIEYLECRNLIDLSTSLYNKPFKLFVAYYLDSVRLIDNF